LSLLEIVAEYRRIQGSDRFHCLNTRIKLNSHSIDLLFDLMPQSARESALMN
jgi:hypothetical protein